MSKHRISVVTGGGSGIGRATARRLAAAGDLVVVADIAESAGRNVVEAIRASGGAAEYRPVDVASEASIAALADEVESRIGPVDVLVTSAGILQNATDIASFDLAEHDRVWAINYRGVYLSCRAFAPRMAKRRRGSIVNVTSLTAELGRPNIVPYAASKGGARQITRGLAVELAPDGIRVNAVSPGYFTTEMNRALLDNADFVAWVHLRTPMKRWGDPDEVAGAVVFLASDASAFITGQTISIDGGFSVNM